MGGGGRKRQATQRAAAQRAEPGPRNAAPRNRSSSKTGYNKAKTAYGQTGSRLSKLQKRVTFALCLIVFVAGLLSGMGFAPIGAMASISPKSIGQAIDSGIAKLGALFGMAADNNGDVKLAQADDAAAFVKKAETTMHFLSVGNADCTVIMSGEKAFLIDAGNSGDAKKIKAYLEELGVKRLEAVVATHPHADHIGGMASIIREFKPKRVYMPDIAATTKTFENMLDAIEETEADLIIPEPGDSFKIGAVSYTVLGPINDDKNTNNYSIVLRGVCGSVSFLMCGDAEKAEEADILAGGRTLSSMILKVAHHGRKTSSTAEFIKAVSPKAAVIHCGESSDGKNGPDDSVLGRLKDTGAAIYRTDKKGLIIIGIDGKTFKVITKQSDTKKASRGGNHLFPLCEAA